MASTDTARTPEAHARGVARHVAALRALVDAARTAPTDEQRCELAAIVAEAVRPLADDAIDVRNTAAEALLRRDPPTHRPFEVARLMRITSARMAQFRRRLGLLDDTPSEGGKGSRA